MKDKKNRWHYPSYEYWKKHTYPSWDRVWFVIMICMILGLYLCLLIWAHDGGMFSTILFGGVATTCIALACGYLYGESILRQEYFVKYPQSKEIEYWNYIDHREDEEQ